MIRTPLLLAFLASNILTPPLRLLAIAASIEAARAAFQFTYEARRYR